MQLKGYKWKNKGSFGILNIISDHVTSCIYDSNYKRILPLMIKSLDIICSLSKDEKGIYA